MTELNKYNRSKIYTIRCKTDTNLVYVGSTVQPLSKRFYEHKHNCYNNKHKAYRFLIYRAIRPTGNIDNWYIELHEEYPCENKEQMLKREGEVIRQIGNLNYVKNTRIENMYEYQIQYQKEYQPEYRIKTKDSKNLEKRLNTVRKKLEKKLNIIWTRTAFLQAHRTPTK